MVGVILGVGDEDELVDVGVGLGGRSVPGVAGWAPAAYRAGRSQIGGWPPRPAATTIPGPAALWTLRPSGTRSRRVKTRWVTRSAGCAGAPSGGRSARPLPRRWSSPA